MRQRYPLRARYLDEQERARSRRRYARRDRSTEVIYRATSTACASPGAAALVSVTPGRTAIVDAGNPHVVIFRDEIDGIDLSAIGDAIARPALSRRDQRALVAAKAPSGSACVTRNAASALRRRAAPVRSLAVAAIDLTRFAGDPRVPGGN